MMNNHHYPKINCIPSLSRHKKEFRYAKPNNATICAWVPSREI